MSDAMDSVTPLSHFLSLSIYLSLAMVRVNPKLKLSVRRRPLFLFYQFVIVTSSAIFFSPQVGVCGPSDLIWVDLCRERERLWWDEGERERGMARGAGEWGIHKAVRGKWASSYKKTTLIVCFINIVVALYVFRSLYASLYIYSDRDSPLAVEYTLNQIRKMEELVRIRKSAEPVELIRLVKQLKKELFAETEAVELPESLKLKLTNEIIEKLKTLPPKANVSNQRGPQKMNNLPSTRRS